MALCRELTRTHDVSVLCSEYDPSRPHGHVEWRVFERLPVIEIVNNWVCRSFAETYRPPLILERILAVLRVIRPDILHIHNLLNLSFDLPLAARTFGIPVVATLHDYGLVCPSGGQRVHQAERHVCQVIDTERCVRCFRASPQHAQVSFARVSEAARMSATLRRAAVSVVHRLPGVANAVARAVTRVDPFDITRPHIDERLTAARTVFANVDLFVAPSESMVREFVRLGIPERRIKRSDYGMPDMPQATATTVPGSARLRVGFAGTLVWHKGAHVLIEAAAALPPGSCEVKIFGNPDTFPAYARELRTMAEGLPVKFMGAFDGNGLAGAYQQIDVLAVPSLWLENSPLVIHEAMMAGKPVIASRIGGIPELVDDGRTGLLHEAGNASELAAALRRLAGPSPLLAALNEGVRRHRGWKSIAADAGEWDTVYQTLLQRNDGTADRL